ncbi:MAG TPA: PA2169 family four-helix-bundle protein [Cyclobacteriaceae bacterium]|jgi:uncharacterized protein (TIGR02284 family)|nr:PA2169 family four-helix-bundle protein [Cyclobacteriaceae bacterium]
MKTGIKKATEVLNGLLLINNDRFEYYRRASERTRELVLKTIFSNVAVESKKNASALIREITNSGNNSVGSRVTLRSWFYRFRMKVKTLLTGKDPKSILDSCVSGEDAAQIAYQDAISSNELTMQARQLLRNQQLALKSFYDMIMAFRNSNPILNP